MPNKNSRSQKRRTLRQRAQTRRRIIQTVVAIGVVGLLGLLIWSLSRPSKGVEVPIMPNSGDHLEAGAPLSYSTSPPTSGPHYANSLPAAFYTEADLASLPPNPEGYLVHNLEHGHVILWYNCSILDDAACLNLQGQIQAMLNEFGGTKVVAFPWQDQDVPLVLTSWGQMQAFEQFDEEGVRAFIETNRNRSPEPNAP